MSRYVEMECTNPKCDNKETWEVYVKFVAYDDDSYDIVVCSDGPGLMSSIHCEECAEEGEKI